MSEEQFQPPKILDVNPLTIRFYCDATDLLKVLDWDGGPPMWWSPFMEALGDLDDG